MTTDEFADHLRRFAVAVERRQRRTLARLLGVTEAEAAAILAGTADPAEIQEAARIFGQRLRLSIGAIQRAGDALRKGLRP